MNQLRAIIAERDAEIERLRVALKKIAYPPSDIDAGYYPIAYARAALTDK